MPGRPAIFPVWTATSLLITGSGHRGTGGLPRTGNADRQMALAGQPEQYDWTDWRKYLPEESGDWKWAWRRYLRGWEPPENE